MMAVVSIGKVLVDVFERLMGVAMHMWLRAEVA